MRLRRLRELLATGEYICYRNDGTSAFNFPNSSSKTLSSSGTLISDTSLSPRLATSLFKPGIKERWSGSRIFAHFMHLAFVLNLTNIISFPSYCGKYGGAVFLIPYTLSYLFVGIPLLYMEMALGQFSSISPVEIFRRISPALSGLAVSVIAIDFYQNLYNSGYITSSTFLGTQAIQQIISPIPWNRCNNSVNSRFCYDEDLARRCQLTLAGADDAACERFWNISEEIAASAFKLWIPPHMDYVTGTTFQTKFKSSDLEFPYVRSVFILAGLWAVVSWLSIIGLRQIGNGFIYLKIFSVLIVFISMILSLCVQREGSGGLAFMFVPHDYSYLLKPDIWSNAVSCVIMSLNLGTGTIHRVSAYSDFNQNFFLNAVIVCISDLLFSISVGTCLFTCMGSLSVLMYGKGDAHLRIQQMYRQTTTMLWTMYPEQVIQVMGDSLLSSFLVAIHYFNFFFLGLSQMVVNVTLIRNALADIAMAWCDAEFMNEEFRRYFFTNSITAFGFALSIIFIQPTVLNLSHLFYQSVCGALMVTCLVELIAIVHGYGFRRFITNIQSMLIGRETEHSIPLLASCFYVITPVILVFSIVLKIGAYRNLIGGYQLPLELELYGRLITLTCLIPIPATLICHLYKLRSRQLIRKAFEPTINWGPSSVQNRHWSKLMEQKTMAAAMAKKSNEI